MIMFKKVNFQDFYQHFSCDDDCRKFLSELKWKKGFVCRRCSNTTSWRGRSPFHQRCARCQYDESCTANTIFHKIRFPLIKAFGMVYQILTLKKGRSTVDLAKEFGVIQSTAWHFKCKIQKAMGEDVLDEIENMAIGDVFSLDSIIITHRGENLNGLQRIQIELRDKNGGTAKPSLITSYSILPDPKGLDMSRLVRGKFKEVKTSILLWNLKVWLTGTHHHCSFSRLKGYLDEFFFKYNYRRQPTRMWEILMERAVTNVKR